ncbi:hypothetical protein E2C01_094672 [Portunus trituberculatus]|uniref:Uncharacterized protein n=1 Tax=Portunus trituberculatus TaxID=210409 RepID=A0A5B7K2A9_PORTR|nr:hypothetical protein [Portunus trituberculatus]
MKYVEASPTINATTTTITTTTTTTTITTTTTTTTAAAIMITGCVHKNKDSTRHFQFPAAFD